MELHGFKEGSNLYLNDKIDKLKIDTTDKDLILFEINNYISARWEEHTLFATNGFHTDINDEKRSKRLSEILNYLPNLIDEKYSFIFVPYKLNGDIDGYFIFLDNELFLFVSPILSYYYDENGHITSFYYRINDTEKEKNYFDQLNYMFMAEKVTKEQQEFFKIIREILIHACYVEKEENKKNPYCTIPELELRLKEYQNTENTLLPNENIQNIFNKIRYNIQTDKETVWINNYNLILDKNLGIILFKELEPIYIVNNQIIYSVEKNEIISKINSGYVQEDIQNFISTYNIYNNNKPILMAISKAFEKKRKFKIPFKMKK